MGDRIVCVGDRPARLQIHLGNLSITPAEGDQVLIPVRELACLVIDGPVSMTHRVISEISEAGGSVVVCSGKHLPTAMVLPIEGNYVQGERFRKQADASLPLKKRLWKQVVRSKIGAQSRALLDLIGNDGGIRLLVPKVKSGDTENIEAVAAQRYWRRVFKDETFVRDRLIDGANSALNFGYACLRAAVARAIVAAGLHPSLGLHHHNKYNAFALADDLMEPFRALIDRRVAYLVYSLGVGLPLDRQAKTEVLEALQARYLVCGEQRLLGDILDQVAQSLVKVYEGHSRTLYLPVLRECPT